MRRLLWVLIRRTAVAVAGRQRQTMTAIRICASPRFSTRPDTVSGGDVLVRDRPAAPFPPATFRVTLNRQDVSGRVQDTGPTARCWVWLTGLNYGRNELAAETVGRGNDRDHDGAVGARPSS